MVGHNVNKQRNHIMNENKPKVATWVLCVDIDPMGDIRDGRP